MTCFFLCAEFNFFLFLFFFYFQFLLVLERSFKDKRFQYCAKKHVRIYKKTKITHFLSVFIYCIPCIGILFTSHKLIGNKIKMKVIRIQLLIFFNGFSGFKTTYPIKNHIVHILGTSRKIVIGRACTKILSFSHQISSFTHQHSRKTFLVGQVCVIRSRICVQ